MSSNDIYVFTKSQITQRKSNIWKSYLIQVQILGYIFDSLLKHNLTKKPLQNKQN